MLREQERRFTPLICFFDCISSLFSLVLAGLVSMKVAGPAHSPLNKYLFALPILAIASAFLYQFRYRHRGPWSQTAGTVMLDAAVPFLPAGAVFAVFAILLSLPPLVFFFAFVFVFFAWLISSILRMAFLAHVRFEQKKGKWIKHVLLAGTGERAREAARLLDGHPGWGLALVGFLTGEKNEVGMIISNHKVVGLVEDLPRILENTELDAVYFAGDSEEAGQIIRLARLCETLGKEFVPHVPGL